MTQVEVRGDETTVNVEQPAPTEADDDTDDADEDKGGE